MNTKVRIFQSLAMYKKQHFLEMQMNLIDF